MKDGKVDTRISFGSPCEPDESSSTINLLKISVFQRFLPQNIQMKLTIIDGRKRKQHFFERKSSGSYHHERL